MSARFRMDRPAPSPKTYSGYSGDMVPTGSKMFDLVLGGGWAIGRVGNIVGDRSAGKTLLAIEATANFARMFGSKNIGYRESENAFDEDYAQTVGFPSDVEPVTGLHTIEKLTDDLQAYLASLGGREPAMYVIDSLDGYSDEAEMRRELGDATYGTQKAKLLSEFFRRNIAVLSEKKCLLLIISQIRENIGVTFGEKYKRAGGKALDFYCSQVVWLRETGKIKREVSKVSRIVGVDIRMQNKKNKVGLPYREAPGSILFSYGFDDETSMLDWLEDTKTELDEKVSSLRATLTRARKTQDRATVERLNTYLRKAVDTRWNEIEESLRPTLSKYA